MLERIGVWRAAQQPRSDGFPEALVKVFLRRLADGPKERGSRAGADAGKLMEWRQSFGRQAIELDDYEVDHIVGVAFGVDAIEVPRPACICVVEDQRRFIRECMEELTRKERI